MASPFIKVSRIEGFEQINAKLAALRELGVKPAHLTKIKALKAGGKVITDEAKRNAPERTSGLLVGRSRKALALAALHALDMRGSTGRRMGKALTSLRGSIGTKFTTGASRDALNIRALVRKPTGHLIEFGHRTKQGTGKAKYYKPKPGGKSSIGARPFMAPAVQTTQSAVVERVAEVINKDLDRLIAGAGK